MSKVRICWGKEQWEVERTELSSLQALRELIQKWTRVKCDAQTLFYHNRCVSTEEEFCDAIESSNPVLYVHSLPPIQVFIKFGWIFKSLSVYAFYPINYIMYLSLDVLESEMSCNLQITDMHLLLKDKVLMNTEATVYDTHIENGDILEIVISNHAIISKVLQAQAKVKCETDYILDPPSLLSSRLLFLELSNGESFLAVHEAEQYLSSLASKDSIHMTMSALSISQFLNENAFVVLLQMLLHNDSTLHVPSSMMQLLSIPLPSIACETIQRDADRQWVCSYHDMYHILSQLSMEEVLSPWRLPWSTASRLGIAEESINALSVFHEMLMGRWKRLGMEKGETVSVGQLIVLMKLQSDPIPDPFPAALWLLMHCSCTQ